MEFDASVLPADWHVKPIREAYAFTKKPRGLSIEDDRKVPFIPMDMIPIGRITVAEFEERLGSALSSGTYIENGDLLVAKITPSFENGKQAIVDWEKSFGFATTEVIPIQEIAGVSDKCFLFHLLLHPAIRSDLAGKMDGTTGRQRLSKEVLGDRLIPLPPLPEQRKIGAVLGVVQRAMEQQERLIALTTELKKALLHKLFTEGLRGESQKQTDIGPVPKSWNLVIFESFATLQRGFDLPRSAFKPGDIPVVGATTIIDYHNTWNVQGPGVTVVRSGSSAGKPLFVPTNFWAHNVVLFVKDFHGNNPKFAYYKIQSLDLTKYREGVAVPTLNRNSFRRIPVAIPETEEQDEFVRTLDAVEDRERVLAQKRDLLFDLFRTLLHQLMTAQIRVHDLDLDEFLALVAREILSQPVREVGNSLSPKVLQRPVRDFEQS